MPCCGKGIDRSDSDKRLMIEDPYIRRRFIVKVLLIVAINLLITTMCASIFVFCIPAKKFLRKMWWIFIPASCILLTIHLMVCYCQQLFRMSPLKFFLLAIYTVAHTVIVCFLVTKYYPKVVFAGFGACTLLVILIGLFAAFAPCDFTSCWIFVFLVSVILMVLGVMAIFFRVMMVVFLGIAVIAYSFFLVIDLQLLIGGKSHKNEYDEEDYIIAALQIYHDIISLFQALLSLVGLLDM
ncbi:hypothetical protein KR054_002803 [Drosophila jambulina]|nr:hypothetical protein KR054_002803 [Drosophila jambulina]